MNQEPQRITLPAFLRQGLVAYREVRGNEQSYKVRDKWKGFTYQFETWQFFILEILPVCDDFSKIASVFKDRFGREITSEEVESVFSLVNEMKLFGSSAVSHPMVAAFNKKKGIRLGGEVPEAVPPGTGARGIPAKAESSLQPSTPAAPPRTPAGGHAAAPVIVTAEPAKPLPAQAPEPVIANTADFSLAEFKDQHKDVTRLIQTIQSGGYQLGTINAPEYTVDWLNGILQLSDLYEKISARRPNLVLSDEIVKLRDQTEKQRKGPFKVLKPEEQNAVRRLNRLMIEVVCPEEAPKTVAIDEAAAEDLGWKLFNPTGLIKAVFPFLQPLKYAVYLLPTLLIVALFTAARNADLVSEDFDRFFIDMKYSYVLHVLISMFTDNLLVTVTIALVAYAYRGTLKAFTLKFHYGFYPRFHVQVGHTEQFSRREQIWFYAAPLLTRLGILSAAVFLWYGTRDMESFLTPLMMTIGAVSIISFLLTVNPLMKSSGYHLLAAVLNEPQLRAKAALALVNKIRGNAYHKVDNNLLVAYGLASSLFMIATCAMFVLVFGSYVNLHFGGAGMFLLALIIAFNVVRLTRKIQQLVEVYERSLQYDRWKKIALPKVDSLAAETAGRKAPLSYVTFFVNSLIVVGLLVPYNYEPGGDFVVLPNQLAELSSENAGIIETVHFDGGESLKQGTVIAQLSSAEYSSQMKIYDAKVQEQQAVVDDLKARPKPEEVALAEHELEVQKTRAAFSGEKLKRYKELYKERTISLEELEDQRREHEVDLRQVEENRAKMELIKAGVTPDQIAAAEGKLQSYKEERDYYKLKIAQTAITMPFDGRLVGINLKQKAGHYLNKGEVFASAENTNRVFAQIEVPEPDIGYVEPSAEIRARASTYHSQEITGVVASIDAIVTEKRSGNVVKVLTLLDNKEGMLQSGMTGYAKISSKTMPAWKVLSLAIIRFIKIDMWSWIP